MELQVKVAEMAPAIMAKFGVAEVTEKCTPEETEGGETAESTERETS